MNINYKAGFNPGSITNQPLTMKTTPAAARPVALRK